MPVTPPPAQPSYPSRRTLREQTGPHEQTGSVTVGDASTAPGYVRVPRIEHVPAEAASIETTPSPRIPLSRRFAAAAAGASVCGLVLALAIPMTERAEANPAAGAVTAQQQQALFSETSTADMPTSFSEINAVDSDEAVQASYTFRPAALVSYPFTLPVLLTDPFGYRTAPVEQFHDAQDFAASEGTQIVSIADGIVTEAGFATDGCGFGLTLEHEIDGDEVTSRYCHMQDASHTYEVGDTVMMGDPVGKVGATGMAFGAHLHLAIRVDDKPVDPMPFLAKYNRIDREKDETTLPTRDGVGDPQDPDEYTPGTVDPTAPATGIETSETGSAG